MKAKLFSINDANVFTSKRIPDSPIFYATRIYNIQNISIKLSLSLVKCLEQPFEAFMNALTIDSCAWLDPKRLFYIL